MQTPSFLSELPARPRILVIRGGGVGDFILILPLLQELRRRLPGTYLEIAGHKQIAEIALAGRLADSVFSIDGAEISSLFREAGRKTEGPASWIENHLAEFDAVISFLHAPGSGFEANLRRAARNCVFLPPPLPKAECHAAEQFMKMLFGTGVSTAGDAFELKLPAKVIGDGRLWLSEQFGRYVEGLVAVHPGSGSRRKNWPLDDYIELVRWLSSERGRRVLLVCGEADEAAAARFCSQFGLPDLAIARSLPLVLLAGVLTHCCLLVGNDSGIGHLTGVVGTPVLSLFGPTSPLVWRPMGRKNKVVRFEDAIVEKVKVEVLGMLEA